MRRCALIYVHHDVPVTHELRAHAAAVLLPAAVVTGPSAAVLWAVPLVDAAADVEVTLPPAAHPRRVPGLRVRRAALRPGDVLSRLGVPVTSAEVTALRLAAVLPGDDAVVAVDRMIATGFTSLAAVRAAWRRRVGDQARPGPARSAPSPTVWPSHRRRRVYGC